MAKKKPNTGGVPATFKEFVTKYPALGLAHEGIAKAVDSVGPIDARTLALIKVGICVGAGLESALRSHVRRAIGHGATRAEVDRTILLGINTVGFPRTVAAWRWARQTTRKSNRPDRNRSGGDGVADPRPSRRAIRNRDRR